jgi:hypothetical protein
MLELRGIAVELTVLTIPDCPSRALLNARLAQVIARRRDVTVTNHVVADLSAAIRYGMRGSPTLLVDGADRFAGTGDQPSVSCRLFDNGDGVLEGAPSVERLRASLDGHSRPQGRRRRHYACS